MGLLPPDSRHADPVIQRLLDWLRGLAGAVVESIFGVIGIEVRFGAASLTWPGASTSSDVLTVTHGLGKTPTAVLATPVNNIGTGGLFAWVGTLTSTTFQIRAEAKTATPAAAVTTPAYWLAIG